VFVDEVDVRRGVTLSETVRYARRVKETVEEMEKGVNRKP
jgi:hypothetical protein